MLDDIFVINPVAHAYNLLPENIQDNVSAESLRDMLLAMHESWNPPGLGLNAEQQQSDWPLDVLARTLFLESDVDVAAFHTLRLDSYMKDGLCRHEKTLEAVTKYPDRFLGYVGVDPTAGLDVCLRDSPTIAPRTRPWWPAPMFCPASVATAMLSARAGMKANWSTRAATPKAAIAVSPKLLMMPVTKTMPTETSDCWTADGRPMRTVSQAVSRSKARQ